MIGSAEAPARPEMCTADADHHERSLLVSIVTVSVLSCVAAGLFWPIRRWANAYTILKGKVPASTCAITLALVSTTPPAIGRIAAPRTCSTAGSRLRVGLITVTLTAYGTPGTRVWPSHIDTKTLPRRPSKVTAHQGVTEPSSDSCTGSPHWSPSYVHPPVIPEGRGIDWITCPSVTSSNSPLLDTTLPLGSDNVAQIP